MQQYSLQETNPGSSTGRKWIHSPGELIDSYSPIDGVHLGSVDIADRHAYDSVIQTALEGFLSWRCWPAPKRGEVVRNIGIAFRKHKEYVAWMITREMGKPYQESLGEVQELIDICDYAVGLSRQLIGSTISSERSMHRIMEQYHPLGIVGIITAFNFPVAVWGWNFILAIVCGNVSVWKPSEKTPLCAVICQRIVAEVFLQQNVPEGVSSLVSGGSRVGEWLSTDKRLPLISATGSTNMGIKVGMAVAARLGRSLLELGGNNAMIISSETDMRLALATALFSAIGTSGQRCTTLRRLIVHEGIYKTFKENLAKMYLQIKIGDPFDTGNHVGPLVDQSAVDSYLQAIEKCKKEGGTFIVEGGIYNNGTYPGGCFVKPCIAEVSPDFKIVQIETFAPILYLMVYKTFDEAIAIQNGVPQGLSSSLMTLNLREAEYFLSVTGSDCGISNINAGTSGAEIGGAFGGEKETGGGRECGSDAWKNYMRRQTSTINYSTQAELAQGIKFSFFD